MCFVLGMMQETEVTEQNGIAYVPKQCLFLGFPTLHCACLPSTLLAYAMEVQGIYKASIVVFEWIRQNSPRALGCSAKYRTPSYT